MILKGEMIYLPPICTAPTWGGEYIFLGKYIPLLVHVHNKPVSDIGTASKRTCQLNTWLVFHIKKITDLILTFFNIMSGLIHVVPVIKFN